jgi:hypothetical protein
MFIEAYGEDEPSAEKPLGYLQIMDAASSTYLATRALEKTPAYRLVITEYWQPVARAVWVRVGVQGGFTGDPAEFYTVRADDLTVYCDY